MTGREQIELELKRLRGVMKEQDDKDLDPVDLAVVEALGAECVREVLEPILDEGACLKAAVLEEAGCMAGVVQLTFDCAWQSGTSHLTQAPAVSALVEISPPKVLKATVVAAPTNSPGVRFQPPSEPVPPALRKMKRPTASEALDFNLQARRSVEEWLRRTGLDLRLPPGGTMALGLTTGTKCTSLLCFERTSDDWDTPTSSFEDFLAPGVVDPRFP